MSEVTTKDVRVLKVWPSNADPQVVSLRVDGWGCFVDYRKDPRNPGRLLRVRGRYGEQAYGNSENCHPDPHIRPFHLHCMASVTRSRRLRGQGSNPGL